MSRNSFMRIELCAYILHHLSHNKWIPFATISWLCCCCCCSFFSCNVYKFYGFFSCLSLCVCISFQFSFGTWTPETPTHTHMCTHWLTSCFAHKRFQWGLFFFFSQNNIKNMNASTLCGFSFHSPCICAKKYNFIQNIWRQDYLAHKTHTVAPFQSWTTSKDFA